MSRLRFALESLRYRWLGPPIGGPDATMRGRWALLALASAVVFVSFFAVGRHVRGASASGAGGGAPLQLRAGSRTAAVPAGLSGGSPIAGAVPVAIVAKPRPRPTTSSAPRPVPVEVARAPSSESSATQAPAGVEATPATTPAAPTSGGGSSEGASTGGGSSSGGPSSGGSSPAGHPSGGGGASSGGGSFDSSE